MKACSSAVWSVLLAFAACSRCLAWGPTGHRIINGLAADSLPAGPLQALFHAHRAYLATHSVDPDGWRGKDKDEGFHHFMDIDHYGPAPFLNLPRTLDAAEAKFGIESVAKYGLVPWVVQDWYLKLADAMRRNDTSHALMDAAVLGHYAADSHVPFHAVENYDGQITGQNGIHARFESVLVDKYIHPETLKPSPVRFLDNPATAVFGWLVESANTVPAVLAADKTAHDGNANYNSAGYNDSFWQGAGPIVTQRLEEGAGDLASLWYSAWIVAGQPRLDAPVSEIEDTFAASHTAAAPPPSPLTGKVNLASIASADAVVTGALDAHDLAEAEKLIGKPGAFRGTLSTVYLPSDHQSVVLDFDPDFHTALTAVIKSANFGKFPDMGPLQGKTLLVTGTFTEFQGQPQIELSQASQLRVVR